MLKQGEVVALDTTANLLNRYATIQASIRLDRRVC